MKCVHACVCVHVKAWVRRLELVLSFSVDGEWKEEEEKDYKEEETETK